MRSLLDEPMLDDRIRDVGIDAVGLERQPAVRLVLRIQELDAEMLLGVDRLDDPLVLGALVDRDLLDLEALDLVNARVLLDQKLVPRDVGDREEIDLPAPGQRHGRGGAGHVGRAVDHQRNEGRAHDGHVFHLDLVHFELSLDRVHDT